MVITNSQPRSRQVLLSQDEDGYFIVEVPSLPGCISQGKTREEALENIKEAIELHLEVLEERGEPIPEDTTEVITV
ncbi:type II toxin-antitoxin system HicB family antitoxin [Thermosynechococcaceae cyanobacterium BACA0444]|uniref:Type II toxin-antitoxin system HicB family antitoxin n=1 Tax=Pseudocalidococcus azoricus BACA0444 TaxID=2918990 RepID=A0AAE4FQS1_9CYAN|nr:type II toxin-antitoxin system HicB family antitoxin [Pseudocalidococcus azoricus]MDS3859958.1 type II toxin-antitoxin system HicB family antitoxin [Pseudocalidococcus azoricus BACA0444]